MKGFFVVQSDQKLVPYDEATQKYIGRRGCGEIIVADIKIARNYGNHKRFFDFLNATYDMQDFYTSLEAYRRWITVAAGWFDIMYYPDGTTQLIPKSISFENMGEDEFNQLFSAAIDAFLAEYGNGLTENDVLQAISYS